MYSSPHSLHLIEYTVQDFIQSPSLPNGQMTQSAVVQRRSYKRFQTNWCFRLFGGISVIVTKLSRPALLRQSRVALLTSSEINGMQNWMVFDVSVRLSRVCMLRRAPWWRTELVKAKFKPERLHSDLRIKPRAPL
ncbi:hypothetical protein Y032_0201g1738 [Ancylostoma ceylanicum]|uniref:Uncharacterized protein n=1 Tax=Ancylostoma ceylanicum TaxID=53326 RepID=A0A016SNE3_9BILA|nr:hypothetical protein Y032_0201g1738 [Ancylostoma ceylanicum]